MIIITKNKREKKYIKKARNINDNYYNLVYNIF